MYYTKHAWYEIRYRGLITSKLIKDIILPTQQKVLATPALLYPNIFYGSPQNISYRNVRTRCLCFIPFLSFVLVTQTDKDAYWTRKYLHLMSFWWLLKYPMYVKVSFLHSVYSSLNLKISKLEEGLIQIKFIHSRLSRLSTARD